MDVGKQRCRAAVMDREGSIIDEFAFANNHQGIEHLASRLTMDDRVAIESTGSVWLNPYERFDERRIPVVLANALQDANCVSLEQVAEISLSELVRRGQ